MADSTATVVPPAGVAALVDAVRTAAARGDRLQPRGAGRWWPDLPPGAAALGLDGFQSVAPFEAADLVTTAGVGCSLETLGSALRARGAFLALDPPGPATRSLGGALATGGGGPLAALYGPPRDQVVGLLVVAGNGAVVRMGGRVVKNVAGFDLAKLTIGGYGGFGVIVEAHLRLRALPASDRSEVWTGTLQAVHDAALRVLAAGAAPAAFEVLSPGLTAALGFGDGWSLAVRALGCGAAVDEELEAVAREAQSGLARAASLRGDTPWAAWRDAVGTWPVILRIGADPSGWRDAVAIAERHLGPLLGASATVPRGTLRIGAGRLDADAAARLRLEAARAGWPVTLERADARTRGAVGVFGALPQGVDRLARSLRATFDPSGVFAAPLFT